MNQLLQNKNITLRALDPTDLNTLQRWETDMTAWNASNTVAPYSRAALWQYLQEYTADIYANRQLRLVVTLTATEEPVGTVDFINFDPLNNHAEIGIYIAPEHRRQGYGTEALALAEGYARDHIGMAQLYAFVAANNTYAIALFDGIGYKRVGELKNWVKRGTTFTDAIFYQRIF